MQQKRLPKPLRKLEKIKRFFYQQDGKCALCGVDLTPEMHEYEEWIAAHLNRISPQKRRGKINMNIDHIVPLSKGGKDKKSNKQLVHAHCNSLKGNNLGINILTNTLQDI